LNAFTTPPPHFGVSIIGVSGSTGVSGVVSTGSLGVSGIVGSSGITGGTGVTVGELPPGFALPHELIIPVVAFSFAFPHGAAWIVVADSRNTIARIESVFMV